MVVKRVCALTHAERLLLNLTTLTFICTIISLRNYHKKIDSNIYQLVVKSGVFITYHLSILSSEMILADSPILVIQHLLENTSI